MGQFGRASAIMRRFLQALRGLLGKRMTQKESPAQFRVAARAHATTIFRDGKALALNYLVDGHLIRLTFRTRYLDRGFAVPVAGDMWMDAVGEAGSPEEAIAKFSNAGRDIAAVISLVMNASVAPLEGELAFEITPGVTRRPFLQRFVEDERMSLSSRFVDIAKVVRVLELIGGHPEQGGLTRAIAQYSEALSHWRLGAELPTLAHLFMGVEAIKTPMWRQRLRLTGSTREDLAKEWGFDPKRRMSIDEFLDAASRGILVFKEDAGALKKAKDVSDAFEHGYRNAGGLYKPARESLHLTAAYLRSAILELTGLEATVRDALLEKYSKPRGLGSLEMYHRSTLVGDTEELAEAGQMYPFFNWSLDFEEVTFNEASDLYEFKPRSNLTASCGSGVVFEGHSIEIWDAGTFSPETAE